MTTPITIAYGDGIGPEIMESAVAILTAAKADLKFNTIEIGNKVYEKGFSAGVTPQAFEELAKTKVLLKAPITTPQGGGFKSLNVTLRKKLGLFANVRPIVSLHPFVKTNFPKMDLVIVRENEEDLYAGIEYRSTDQTYTSIKLVSRDGCEKIIRYAFEYAVKNGRKKVTCMSKDNIMKLTDGLFHKIFNEIAAEYKQIAVDHYIIDIGTARLAAKPEIFDVIVTLNLYGDIISDVAAEISGSVGLAGSANIGENFAMFEAIHGSAPDIAGKNIANPSGLLNAAVMMLVHIGQVEAAAKIRDALYKTIEDGIHPADIFGASSKVKAGTKEFTKEVIARLGSKPAQLPVANFVLGSDKKLNFKVKERAPDERKLIGLDLYVNLSLPLDELVAILPKLGNAKFEVKMFSCRGVVLWPYADKSMIPEYYAGQGDLRVRIIGKGIMGQNSQEIASADSVTIKDILELLSEINARKIVFSKYEGLFLFNGKPGFSSGQGE